jgi:hypothetical protein
MHKFFTFCILIFFALLQGCTTVAESAAVLVVSVHSHYEEIKGRQFKPTHPCLFKTKPDPYEIAESIAYGNPITSQYEKILDPGDPNEAYSMDPPLPHYVAEAFYIVADRLGDVRAAAKQEWLSMYFPPKEPAYIKKYMDRKYTTSYLDKCFVVPESYKRRLSVRDKLK